MKYLLACVVLALKSFFQAVVNVLLYILEDPKEKKGAQNRWQGRDWRKTSGRQCTCQLLSVFLFTLKLSPQKSFAKGNVSGGNLRESEAGVLFDIV